MRLKRWLPEVGLATGILVIWVLAVIALSGCVSVNLNLAGGRTLISHNISTSGKAESHQDLEAATELSESANPSLKFPSSWQPKVDIPNVKLPSKPTLSTPEPEPEPNPTPPLPLPEPTPDPGPAPAGSVKVDGKWIPAPSNPSERLGEGTPGWVEREQPLWKASSEHGGKLVILLPMSLRPKEVIVYAASPDHRSVKELGRTKSFTRNGKNGNRTHWRLPKSGGAYRVSGHDTKLKVYLQEGTLWYDVPKPASRHVMQVSRHQDKPR